ncbi:hypothetical protein [Sabulicella rubraurantiaca]|uniref:hypothetical protein n=1 Tax=Sabulicella rubraurantiaca TaxID=2811429 RepID=UPI001A971CC0|nr:hypothetical protein [Sabulicella rubraurantiaca]
MAVARAERERKRGERALLFAGAVATLGRMEVRGRAKPRLSAPHPWRLLTEAEIRFVWPVREALCAHEVGRPARHDLLSRFEACLEAACSRLPWRQVETRSAPGMKGDTLHRNFRRWTERRLWMALLLKIGREKPDLLALEYFLCRAFRRA